MYSIVRSGRLSEVLAREAPAGLAAMVVAEVFYKFHSFSLECLAFLGTWYAFSWALNRVPRARR